MPKNLDEDDPAYLSMLNQSLRANNLDFSVDISTVMGAQASGANTQINTGLANILEDEELNQGVSTRRG